MAKVIDLGMEPIIGCECGSELWLLITTPHLKKIPYRIIFFKCPECGQKIETDIKMGDV